MRNVVTLVPIVAGILLIKVLCPAFTLGLNEKQQERNWLSSDPQLLSSYRESSRDGYSWRKRIVRYNKDALEISQEYLVSTYWTLGPEKGWLEILVFYLDNVFKFGTPQTGVWVTGRFDILDSDTVRISDFQYMNFSLELQKKYPTFDRTEASLILEKGMRNFWAEDGLRDKANNTLFYAEGSGPPLGTKWIIDGMSVRKISERFAVIKQLPFHKLPSTSSEVIKTTNEFFIETTKAPFFLPGKILWAYAKTGKVHLDRKKTEQWYYIIYGSYDWPEFGWVLGEGLESYNPSRKQEYDRILADAAKEFNATK